jgi:two-component system, cell cycle sensor histidine kinase and response regulator CckA
VHLANRGHCASPAEAIDPHVLTILLVEDETLVRDAAGEILRSAGYRVLAAPNAAHALHIFRGHPEGVQLLLTDVVLPDRNGCDLACELTAVSDHVKTIFISGYPENSITRKGLSHPGWFYLPKPFSAGLLLQRVREVLTREAMEKG